LPNSVRVAARLRAGLGGGGRWLLVPFRLVRDPGVLTAVVASACILASIGAAATLFVASAGDAALAGYLEQMKGHAALTVEENGLIDDGLIAGVTGTLDTSLHDTPGLTGMTITMEAGPSPIIRVRPSSTGGAGAPVELVFRTGFPAHIRRIGTSDSKGVWLTDSTAKDLGGVRAGDTVALLSDAGKTLRVPVAGVYRSLATLPRAAYWAPLALRIFGTGDPMEPPPPALLLADQRTIQSLTKRLGETASLEWSYGLGGGIRTLAQARALASRLHVVIEKLVDPSNPLGAIPGQGTEFTPIPDVLRRALDVQASIVGPVAGLSLAGSLLALAGMGVAGVYAVRRRRAELTLLVARGVGRLRLGLRTIVEVLLPLAVGGGLGWAAAVAVVKAAGPSAVMEQAALQASGRPAILWILAAMVLIAFVVARTAGRELSPPPGRVATAAGRAPWEAVVLALAAASLYEIVMRGTVLITGKSGPPRVDQLFLLFPFLFLAGMGGLIVRGLRRYLSSVGTERGGRSTAAFLARRRLSDAPRTAVVLVTAASVAVGMVSYAGVLAASVDATSSTKALVSVGSATTVALNAPMTLPANVTPPLTAVTRIQGKALLSPGDRLVDILAVDPATFARAVYWDPTFSSESLGELMDRLSATPTGRLPAIVVGARLPARSALSLQQSGMPLTGVGTASAFPGMVPGRPLIVVAQAQLVRVAALHDIDLAGAPALYEAWSPAAPRAVLAALLAHHAFAGPPQTAEHLMRSPAFLALSWTLGFLQALGGLAGVMALVGLLLYLQARQRSREVAYALSRRMGLTRSAHRRSVALELTAMLGAAFVVGSTLSVAAALLVYGRLDLLPELPPAPLLRLPPVLFGSVLVVLAAAAWAGAAAVQWQAERTSVAEVMRLAE
jgi:putative ABC transport system permease protein